jgi:hypothetical protein
MVNSEWSMVNGELAIGKTSNAPRSHKDNRQLTIGKTSNTPRFDKENGISESPTTDYRLATTDY